MHCLRTGGAFLICLAVASGLPAQEEDVKIQADVVYGHKFGLALTLDVFQPQTNANGAGVLFMVSGGWYSNWQPPEKMQGMFKPLTDKGFTVFAVRHGSSPKFGIPEAVEDVRRAVRYIRVNAERFGVDPQRLGVYGYSAGGHLSLMLGTASDEGNPRADDLVLQAGNRVQAVVAVVAPTDLRIMVRQAPDRLPAYDRFPALDLPLDELAAGACDGRRRPHAADRGRRRRLGARQAQPRHPGRFSSSGRPQSIGRNRRRRPRIPRRGCRPCYQRAGRLVRKTLGHAMTCSLALEPPDGYALRRSCRSHVPGPEIARC